MVTLDEASAVADGPEQDVLALHEALERLAQLDPQAARIVEMSFFGGMTQVEIAHTFDRSERWVRDQLTHAKAWLRRELAG
jgi:RNA polymerase sigma factor (sigma-70 family)